MYHPIARALGVNPKKFWGGLWERFLRALPRRVWMLIYFYRALTSPLFERAMLTVSEVARDPSTRSLDSWTAVAHLQVSNPKWGENMYRGLSARVKMHASDPETALLLELAYLIYKRRRRL